MCRAVCAISLLCGYVLLCVASDAPKKMPLQGGRDTRDTLSILVESYNLSKELVPSDRAILLNFLCHTAGEHHLPYTVSWAEENYLLAHQLPMDWNRVAVEKNAVVAISYVKPKRAMTLLKLMDLPVPEPNGSIMEDVRSDGAILVFENLLRLKSKGALASIRETAMYLGRTGQYPYFAIEGIVLELTSKPKERSDLPVEASSLVIDAFSSYRRGSKDQSEDSEFVHFLKALRPILPAPLFKEGLEEAVDRLLNEPSLPGNDPKFPYVAKITTQSGVATFDRRQDATLFSLLPLIREIDPTWTDRIVGQNQTLSQAGGNSGKGVTTQAGIYTSKPEDQAFVSDYLKLQSVNVMVQENPEEALRVSQSIANTALRASAMASIANVLSSSAPDQTENIEETISALIPNIKNANDRLTTLSALAKTAAAAKDHDTFRDVLRRSFTLGEELFEEDSSTHPVKSVFGIASFNALKDVVVVGASFDPRATLSSIYQLRNTALRAYLLAAYADAAYARGDNAATGTP